MANIVGRGVRFPFHPGPTGGFSVVANDETVFQAMRLILSTAVGERQMRFAFGSELPNLLFAPVTGATLAAIEDAARSALRNNEPRIRVLSITATPATDVESRVDLVVDFVLNQSSRRQNLVFPFYLQEG